MTRRSRRAVAIASGVSTVILLAAATVSADHRKPSVKPAGHPFGFLHKETTGIVSFLLVDGKETAIQFSRRSNRAAKNALFALKTDIFLPNTHDGKRLFVIGSLDPAVKHTPSAPNRAASEPYHEFTLQGWYIKTPFTEQRELPGDPGRSQTILHKRLQRQDFRSDLYPDLDLRDVEKYENSVARDGR